MRLAVLLALAASLVGCEPPPPGPRAPSGARSADLANGAAPPLASSEAPEALAGFVCDVEATALAGEHTSLRLFASQQSAARGEPMATVNLESGRLRLSPAERDGVAQVELDGFGLSASGLARLSELPVHVRETRRLAGGMITPGARLSARITSVDAQGVIVQIASFSGLDPELLPLEERLGCADLGAAPAAAAPTSGAPVSLDVADELELLPARGAAPGTGLRVVSRRSDRRLPARELERSADQVRVAIHAPEGVISGWVDADRLGPPIPGLPEAPLAKGASGDSPTAGQRASCDHELGVAARVGDTLFSLGRTRPRTPLHLSEERGDLAGWRRVALAAARGETYVREAQLTGCDALP